MKWNELLRIVGKEPVFHSSLLKAGMIDPVDLGRQLSRWVKSDKLIQIRRGLYALSERYQKTSPHRFFVARLLKRASYISLQSALEYYGLIPEYVPNVISVTTGRPETLSTPIGAFIFKHIKKDLFFGYKVVDIGDEQSALIALPEKALLDLLYLTPGSDNIDYIRELRLQNLDTLNLRHLKDLTKRTGSRKLLHAIHKVETLLSEL